MSRFRAVLFLILFTLALPVLFMEFTRWQTAVAAPPNKSWEAPNIGLVMDTTESMLGELAIFADAWQDAGARPESDLIAPGISSPDAVNCHPYCGPLTASLKLTGFRDEAMFLGSTTDYDEFTGYLGSLEASGGAGCLDNALGGLLAMSENLPAEKTPASDVLLVTDATPSGTKANFVYVFDRMIQRGINVNTLLSGWCPGAAMPEKALEFLTLATGGRYYRVEEPGDYYTITLMARERLFSTDLVVSEMGSVTDSLPDMIPIEVDSSMFGLGAETTLGWTGCLTCPRPVNTTGVLEITAVGGMQFQLVDPDNNVINASNPNFSQIGTSTRELLSWREPLTATLQPGTWHLRVTGNGSYAVSVAAQSSFHMAYVGPTSVPVNQPTLVRVLLGSQHEKATIPPQTASFRLVAMDGSSPDQSIMLFDDGLHDDVAAGDGIYGGMVTPIASGWWRIMATGDVGDGSSYQRLAEIPLRVQAVSVKGPDAASAKPNETQLVSFELTNDASASTTTFELGLFSEQGWAVTGAVPAEVTLDPGETVTIHAEVVVPVDATNGMLEEVTFVAVATNDENTAVSALAEITVEANAVYLPMIVK